MGINVLKPYPILFVCLGNICRSPLGEGIFRHLARERGVEHRFPADSAGTGAWHAGSPPDPRSVEIARRHQIDISAQRARQLTREDFDGFALILAMDRANLAEIRRSAPSDATAEIALFSEYTGLGTRDVPDPYYGGEDGFAKVYSMLFSGCNSLVTRLGDQVS